MYLSRFITLVVVEGVRSIQCGEEELEGALTTEITCGLTQTEPIA